jgi:hypothetical protein
MWWIARQVLAQPSVILCNIGLPLPDFENEQEEMARAVPPVDLTPELWVSYPFHENTDS